MRWDEVKKDVAEIRDPDLRKAVKERNQLKITRLIKNKNGCDPQLFSFYVAVAYGLNDQKAIENLRCFGKNNRNFTYGCSQWGRWLEAHEIEPFAHTFGLWADHQWDFAVREMIKHNHNAELGAVLNLRTTNGCKVLDPLQKESRLLWETCIEGKQEGFEILLPVSDFKAGGHRCFIAAAHNKHMEIAHTILLKSDEANLLDDLRANVDDYVKHEVDTPQEADQANIMYALIDNIKLTHALEDVQTSNRSRKM